MQSTSELTLLVAIESRHLRSHITGAQKTIIANYFMQNSINKVVEQFGVEQKSIRKWIHQLSELTNVSVKPEIKTRHKEIKVDTKEKEDEFVEWILIDRYLRIAVT